MGRALEVDENQSRFAPYGWLSWIWTGPMDACAAACVPGLPSPCSRARPRQRWLQTVEAVYRREHKLVEKYTLDRLPHPHSHSHATGGAGGEYPLQDGFGWTNGVTRNWLDGTEATLAEDASVPR